MIKIIQRRKIWFAFSLILTIASIAALTTWGLKLGIDYTGGSMMEISFNENKLSSGEIAQVFTDLNLGGVTVQFSGEKDAFLRFKEVDEPTHQSILAALNKKAAEKAGVNTSEEAAQTDNSETASTETAPVEVQAQTAEGENVAVNAETISGTNESAETPEIAPAEETEKTYITEKSFDAIGPIIGSELKNTTVWATIIALIGIVAYIAGAFRKVSYPVSSFKYGLCATIALFHDVIITAGIFSVLGHYYGIEIGATFLAAILAILGYSVNDTIVVFDRTRENLLRGRMNDFEDTVNYSVNETFARSINTSFTTLLMLFVLYLFGGASIQTFVLALIVGISFGTYSSIFIASPLLVTWQHFDAKKRSKK